MAIDTVKIEIEKTSEGEGHNYLIDYCYLEFEKALNKLTGHPGGGTTLDACFVQFTIDLEKEIGDLFEWSRTQNAQKDVTINFYESEQLKKTYKLNKAYLIQLNHTVKKLEGRGWQQIIFLRLSPRSIEADGDLFEYQA